jgi:RNA polymerase sigma factor (sigma-70 family)
MKVGLSQRESPPASPATSDEALVARFVRLQDEEAFAELVERHGPLVMSVCRRVLCDPHDADDAFQATFLVLAARPGGIRRPQALAAWLYGVAFRIARRLAIRRRRRGMASLTDELPVDADPLQELTARHDRHVIDEELNRLPARLRDPLVLYYLEGKSQKAVAEALGVTVSAVDGRMKRGRRRLRMRLVARGVSLGVLTAIALARTAESAAPQLVVATVQAGLAQAGGTSIAGVASPLVRQLAREEVSQMTFAATKSLLATAAICAVVLLGVGGFGALSAQQAESNSGRPSIALPPTAPGLQADEPAVQLAQASTSDDIGTEDKPLEARAAPPTEALRSDDVDRKKYETLDYKSRSREMERVLDELEKDTTILYIDTPFSDVKDYLSDLHGISIIFDKAAMEKVGIAVDHPITSDLKGISLRAALEVVLEPLDLDYVVRNGVLQITSKQAAARRMETHVYELRQLGGMDPEEVARAIRTTIRPGQWVSEDDGSAKSEGESKENTPQGAVALVGEALVVTHNQHVQEKVVDLLEQLARFSGNPLYETPPSSSSTSSDPRAPGKD